MNLDRCDQICQTLDELGITYTKFDHDAVFTCDASEALGLDTKGIATKNLFLRDRKGKRHFLVIIPSEKIIDLKALGETMGVKGIGFASPERLQTHLSTTPGSVSVLDILNDSEHAVELIIEQLVWESDALQCHPYTNTATLDIALADIRKLLDYYQRDANVMAL